MGKMARCEICFRHCEIPEGKLGFCKARTCKNGVVTAENYGCVTSLALDPIEKKPLHNYYPGKYILSVGSYGCNLRCPFCQNSEISWSDDILDRKNDSRYLSPEDLVDIAVSLRSRGNIGLAFTYNEPLIGFEYVFDTAKIAHERGLKNILVTNGCGTLQTLSALSPYIDAMNIDLKGFTENYYNKTLGGDLDTVMRFIEESVKFCHVELTTLIVPGENDTEKEMRAISEWIASLKNDHNEIIGKNIPLHISRFFPRFHYSDRRPTDVGLIYHLADIAREKLTYVYTGNC